MLRLGPFPARDLRLKSWPSPYQDALLSLKFSLRPIPYPDPSSIPAHNLCPDTWLMPRPSHFPTPRLRPRSRPCPEYWLKPVPTRVVKMSLKSGPGTEPAPHQVELGPASSPAFILESDTKPGSNILLALGCSFLALHEPSCSLSGHAKALPVPISGPVPGLWAQT